MRKAHYVLITICVMVLLLTGPFLVVMGINEIRLHRFAAQLGDVPFPAPSRILSQGANFYPAIGSAPACDFEATLVVQMYVGADAVKDFSDDLRRMEFENPRTAENGRPPDVNVIVDGSIVVLTISAGPWDTMDPRCL